MNENKDIQVKNSFDVVTRNKILKSLGLTLIAVGGVYITTFAQTRNHLTSALSAISAFGAWITNTAIEYNKGEE